MADTVAFSIPVGNEPPGRAKQKLASLLGKIETANLRLRAISWFSYGRRGRLFCVPDDPEAFRAFARANAVRAREVSLINTSGSGAMANLHKVALSGSDIHAFSALSSSRSVSFVWFKEKA